MLQSGKQFFVRTRSTDGVEGIVLTKDMEDFVPILQRRVIPHFLGKDARDLETLVDDVYIANYKLSGQAFWCPVAYVEQSLFDLLGKTARKPAGELMGGILRKEIPVYLSGSGRDTTAEEEVDVYVHGVAETGAKAVKFKIGGRMSAQSRHLSGPHRQDLRAGGETARRQGHADGRRQRQLQRREGDRDRQAPAGDEVPLVRGAVPLGGIERDQESGRCARR